MSRLRVPDAETGNTWRILYCIDPDAVLVLDVFAKKTQTTPKHVIDGCRTRLRTYRQRTEGM